MSPSIERIAVQTEHVTHQPLYTGLSVKQANCFMANQNVYKIPSVLIFMCSYVSIIHDLLVYSRSL